MPQERCVPHAIAWRGHNPYQVLPEHLVQSYPSLNAHTVGYSPFWGNGIPEHLHIACAGAIELGTMWIRARESSISLLRWRRQYHSGPPVAGNEPKDTEQTPVVPRYCSPGLPSEASSR